MVFALTLCISASAQKMYDTPVRVVVSDETLVAASSDKYLYDRLQYVLAGSGMGAENAAARFYVYPVLSERSNVLVGSVPAMYAVELDMTLYLADLMTGKVYAAYPAALKGAGRSVELAYRSAFKGLDKDGLSDFMGQAHREIINYFTSEGTRILKSADTYASMKDYPQALFLLASIPSSCDGIYQKAQDKMVKIYGEYIEYEGKRLLSEAKNVWAASQDRDGAVAAMALINEIAPEASCNAEAEKFVAQVSKRIGEEWEVEKKIILSGPELEKQRIEAAKQVGVAYGNNQKPTTLVLDK